MGTGFAASSSLLAVLARLAAFRTSSIANSAGQARRIRYAFHRASSERRRIHAASPNVRAKSPLNTHPQGWLQSVPAVCAAVVTGCLQTRTDEAEGCAPLCVRRQCHQKRNQGRQGASLLTLSCLACPCSLGCSGRGRTSSQNRGCATGLSFSRIATPSSACSSVTRSTRSRGRSASS